MSTFSHALIFLARCIVIGLALACVALLVRPSLLGRATQGNGAPLGYADAVARSTPAVVNIYTTRVVASPMEPGEALTLTRQTNLGSGVIIDPAGYIVTNFHVIDNASAGEVQLADGRTATPAVVGVDEDTDLALLKIDLDNLTPISLGRSDQVQIGDVVLAIGSPYGLSHSVTQGIVSATGRGLLGLTTFENYIQTDAAINSGNSGGALINTRGELIGINTAVISREVNIQGISFAIPVNLVSGVVQALRRDGRVQRGWLGLEMADLAPQEAERLGLESGVGVLLRAVLRAGPAWDAGIRPGDVLIAVNGERIVEPQQALLLVAGNAPGAELDLDYLRDGEILTTTATAGDRVLSRLPLQQPR